MIGTGRVNTVLVRDHLPELEKKKSVVKMQLVTVQVIIRVK